MARHMNSYEHIAALIARAQAGDQAAFAEAYRLTAQAQYFAIAAKVGPDAAPDLLQETYLVAWKNLSEIRPRSFVGYLNAVARNLCLRHYERTAQPRETALGTAELEAAEQHADRAPAPAHATDPAIVANTRDERMRLARALREELDDREREVILMRFYQDMRIDDIAANLEVSESTVKRTVKRALDKLRDKLGYLPFGPAFTDLLRKTVEDPLAKGARPRPVARRRGPWDHAVRAVAVLSAVAVVGAAGFAAFAHGVSLQAQPIEEDPAPAAESPSPQRDTTPPELLDMYTDQGFSLLHFTEESGMADVQLIAKDGTAHRAVAIEVDDAGEGAAGGGAAGAGAAGAGGVAFRFSVPSGTYAVTATDRAGNTATGEITVELPPDDPGPYAPTTG